MTMLNKTGNVVQCNSVARSRNVYTSSAILTASYHFIRRQRFYGDQVSPVKINRT